LKDRFFFSIHTFLVNNFITRKTLSFYLVDEKLHHIDVEHETRFYPKWRNQEKQTNEKLL
jgi:hypothetical protein